MADDRLLQTIDILLTLVDEPIVTPYVNERLKKALGLVTSYAAQQAYVAEEDDEDDWREDEFDAEFAHAADPERGRVTSHGMQHDFTGFQDILAPRIMAARNLSQCKQRFYERFRAFFNMNAVHGL